MKQLRIAIILALCCSTLFAVQEGKPLPPVVAKQIVQKGQTLATPLNLDQYRGAPLLLMAWYANGNAGSKKRKLHESMVKLGEDLEAQHIRIFGISDDAELVLKGTGQNTTVGAPILILDEAMLKTLGPFEPLKPRRLLVSCDGTVIVAQQDGIFKDDEIAAAITGMTYHGRWMNLHRPYFANETPARKVQPLRLLVNQAQFGKAMAKAAKLADDKDEATVSEAGHLLKLCQEWVDKAVAIEQEARAAGDIYTAYLIADELGDLLKGHDAGDEADDRAKADKKHEGYKLGKAFHDTWKKTWGKPRADADKAFASFVKKYEGETGYVIDLAKRWSGE